MEAHGFNMYDYGARFYDQTLGCWHSMDPLAEKYYSVSPYAYCAGNPVMFVDPDGRYILNVVSGISNSLLNYSSQVAANLLTGCSFKEALVRDISVGSIIISGIEGAINSVGATARNLSRVSLKAVGKKVLKESLISAQGQILDNVIKGEEVLNNVSSEVVAGGLTGNFKLSINNSNTNTVINKMNKKLDKGKVLTKGQQRQMDSALDEKAKCVATELTINNLIKTATNIVSNDEDIKD